MHAEPLVLGEVEIVPILDIDTLMPIEFTLVT